MPRTHEEDGGVCNKFHSDGEALELLSREAENARHSHNLSSYGVELDDLQRLFHKLLLLHHQLLVKIHACGFSVLACGLGEPTCINVLDIDDTEVSAYRCCLCA
jgi:hypothetical protein